MFTINLYQTFYLDNILQLDVNYGGKMTKKKIISLITSFFFGLTLLLQPVVSFAMTLDELIAAAQKEGEVNT